MVPFKGWSGGIRLGQLRRATWATNQPTEAQPASKASADGVFATFVPDTSLLSGGRGPKIQDPRPKTQVPEDGPIRDPLSRDLWSELETRHLILRPSAMVLDYSAESWRVFAPWLPGLIRAFVLFACVRCDVGMGLGEWRRRRREASSKHGAIMCSRAK